ncbi:MAG: MlaD family protein [Gelidibacter sp.]|uniref:MlaD family protein n=1 Tax=Gelidibacter sp. TaxID=2018083 RepID=UPI003266E9F2
MGKSTSQKIKVGIFVIVGTLLLIVALYFIGSRQQMFSKNILLYGIFEDVNGLQLGNNVRYSGVNVGTVSRIEMLEAGKITVGMSIEEKAARFIKKDAIASIGSDGLVGSMVVNIVPGEDKSAQMVVSGDLLQVYSKTSTTEMLSTLDRTNENVALISANLLTITNQLVEGKGTLGALMSDSLMAQDLKRSMDGLRKMTLSANEAVSQINTIVSKINYDDSAAALLLSDTVSKNQIQHVFGNLEKSSDHIKEVTKSLEDYISDIKTSKGTLNYITQDKILIKNIDSTMINIKEASEKLNENMEALKHNFFFRGYFKRQEKKKLKEAKEK